MKRILSLLIALALTLSLAGCGTAEPSATQDQTQPSTEATQPLVAGDLLENGCYYIPGLTELSFDTAQALWEQNQDKIIYYEAYCTYSLPLSNGALTFTIELAEDGLWYLGTFDGIDFSVNVYDSVGVFQFASHNGYYVVPELKLDTFETVSAAWETFADRISYGEADDPDCLWLSDGQLDFTIRLYDGERWYLDTMDAENCRCIAYDQAGAFRYEVNNGYLILPELKLDTFQDVMAAWETYADFRVAEQENDEALYVSVGDVKIQIALNTTHWSYADSDEVYEEHTYRVSLSQDDTRVVYAYSEDGTLNSKANLALDADGYVVTEDIVYYQDDGSESLSRWVFDEIEVNGELVRTAVEKYEDWGYMEVETPPYSIKYEYRTTYDPATATFTETYLQGGAAIEVVKKKLVNGMLYPVSLLHYMSVYDPDYTPDALGGETIYDYTDNMDLLTYENRDYYNGKLYASQKLTNVYTGSGELSSKVLDCYHTTNDSDGSTRVRTFQIAITGLDNLRLLSRTETAEKIVTGADGTVLSHTKYMDVNDFSDSPFETITYLPSGEIAEAKEWSYGYGDDLLLRQHKHMDESQGFITDHFSYNGSDVLVAISRTYENRLPVIYNFDENPKNNQCRSISVFENGHLVKYDGTSALAVYPLETLSRNSVNLASASFDSAWATFADARSSFSNDISKAETNTQSDSYCHVFYANTSAYGHIREGFLPENTRWLGE